MIAQRRPSPCLTVSSSPSTVQRPSSTSRIASASSGATVSCRMLLDTRTASVAWMLSVITIFSIGAAPMRATAPPDSTPCVT